MHNLLVIDTSPRGDRSTSRKLTEAFARDWQSAHVDAKIVRRDLAAAPLPYIDLPWIGGAFTPPERHTPESRAAIKVSDDLIAELRAADHLVIGTPMYNFSIPAVLKAWVDHIVRVGVTVKDNVGQLAGKTATIIIASGGDFSPGSPIEGFNQASGYLRAVLKWIGVEVTEIVLANRERAGESGEHALEQFGGKVAELARAS